MYRMRSGDDKSKSDSRSVNNYGVPGYGSALDHSWHAMMASTFFRVVYLSQHSSIHSIPHSPTTSQHMRLILV